MRPPLLRRAQTGGEILRHRHDLFAGVFNLATWTNWSEREITSLPAARLVRYLNFTKKA